VRRTASACGRALALLVLGGVVAVGGAGCKRPKRSRVDAVRVFPYPSCGREGALSSSEEVASGMLRAGPGYRDKAFVERWSIHRRDCLEVATTRVELGRAAVDLEIVYDARGVPLRVWRRVTVPVSPDGRGAPVTTLFELRSGQVETTERDVDGTLRKERVAGGRPRAIVPTPSVGLLTAWIRRAGLPVGESIHDIVLDLGAPELVREAMLRREPDLDRPRLGRVRVYTVYGRDAFFADAEDRVVGDLAGLVRADVIDAPLPPPMPMHGEPDPVGTP
jgi:hypothetical protein